jgi:UDP-N-acetylglucosamine--N-acetylmuramyl-(pentapeptide) pyrophosphoryl-undecaprenol N-acetylglucosamine transferase
MPNETHSPSGPHRAARHALLAGGGSGGHVFPALAVAEELVVRDWRVTCAGSRHGMEADLVAQRGFDFLDLPARPLVGRGPVGQVRALWTLGRSMLEARRAIRRLGVDAVVGTGGYVSAPAVLGARLAGRASLLVEPNVEAGLANRWLSRWASGAAVAYQSTADQLYCPAVVTGVPVRHAFFEIPDLEVGSSLGSPVGSAGSPTPISLLVVGGSQGARQLNLTVPEALARLEARAPGDGTGSAAGPRWAERLRVIHQAGRRQADQAREAYAQRGPKWIPVEVVAFLDDMAGALADAHLVISRAGALATAELCAAGRPSILVPLVLAGAHQMANARHLAEAGAARLLTSEELTPESLARAIEGLAADDQALAAAGRAARALAHRDAVAAIARELEELVFRSRRKAREASGGARDAGRGADA